MSIFRLTMLPASEGDSLILSYGKNEAALRHIVIDGGRAATWPHLEAALAKIAARGEDVELLLLTHIDADHIDGLVEMMENAALPLIPKTIWYNGYEQLKAMVAQGGLQPFGLKAADAYSKALAARGWPVNQYFGGKAIFIENGPIAFEYAGLKLNLISPDRAKLDKLRNNWRKAMQPAAVPSAAAGAPGLQAFGKRPMPASLDVEKLSGPSGKDSTAPNGSSIALVAEYAGRRVLLGADAHPDIAAASLAALGEGAPYRIDLAKLPHHGSRANVTRALLETIACNRFAISTSGAVFGHPDPEAISRVLKFGTTGQKTLYFNYDSDRTRPWDAPALKAEWKYSCEFPAAPGDPLVIDI